VPARGCDGVGGGDPGDAGGVPGGDTDGRMDGVTEEVPVGSVGSLRSSTDRRDTGVFGETAGGDGADGGGAFRFERADCAGVACFAGAFGAGCAETGGGGWWDDWGWDGFAARDGLVGWDGPAGWDGLAG
jgi:hypothetical protein